MVNKKKRDEEANLEKEKLLNPERMEEKRKKRKKRIAISIACGAVLLIVVMLSAFGVARMVGKNSLRSKAAAAAPDLSPVTATEVLTEEEKETWQEGWVKYNGIIYAYNKEMMTFLFMGIDKDGDAKEVAEGTDGGQADALFLVAVNPKDRTVKVIGLNRNTMADVDIYNEEGAYVNTVKAQIAVQHGFGNGMEESCDYQCKAVSRLLYGLPIHGYAAINMAAIPALNDAVGGVDVTVQEDISIKDPLLVKGAQVHLEGKSAFWYVKYRDMNQFGSADGRLERQKQYLAGFMDAAKKTVKEDISAVSRLYSALKPMMVTNVTSGEAVYLATELLDYDFWGKNEFRMIEGETVMGEVFEEFYVDEEALYEMILDIFYEPVDGQ